MRRLDDYNCKKPSNNENKQDKRLGIGIVFIFIGALFILSNIGLIPYAMKGYVFSWQMVLIIIGLFNLAGNKNRRVGLILISIGVFFILPGFFGMERIGLGKLWPLVFVGIGAYVLLRRKSEINRHDYDFETDETANNEDILDDISIFSGVNRAITSKNFLGGKVTAIFGGADYNFLNADLAGDRAVLDVVAIFGGFKIVAPPDWDVVIDVVPIFGGFSDKRKSVDKININSNKKLIIKGLTIFGGGELKSR